MGHNYYKKFIALAIIICASVHFTGCGAKTDVDVVNAVNVPPKINAENIVMVRDLHFSGKLGGRHRDLFPAFMTGFTRIGGQLMCAKDPEYHDAVLDILIETKYESTGLTRAKYIPVVGGMMYAGSGGTLDFEWEGTVYFTLYDIQGNPLLKESFLMKGKDSMESDTGLYGMTASYLTGGGVDAAFYPDKEAKKQLGDEFLRAAGDEISKRIRTNQARIYFEQRTKDRDGMDPKTYAAFIVQKNQLIEDRKTSEQKEVPPIATTGAGSLKPYPIKNGKVMVVGVGIDQYEHFSNLNYAVNDCEKVVGHFKQEYGLSDNWAITFKDKDATAIKVLRFIKKNVPKLLDKDDTFIFYFSGHGAPEPNARSNDNDGLKKYLLLSDSEPGAFSLTALSLDNLAQLLSGLPCKRVLLLIDSCFAGVAGKDTLSQLKTIRISESTYQNVANISGKGRAILAASAENQVSQEWHELRSGVFTYYLIQGLQSKADINTDQKVDILELYQYVRDQVSKATNGAQTPVFRGALDQNIEF